MKDEIKDKIIEKYEEILNMKKEPDWRYTLQSEFDKYNDLIKELASLKSQLSEAYKDCIYRNEEGGCWAIKLKCDPRNENCDYRKEEKLSEAGEEKPIIKKCRQCRFFDLDEHCEPCESCYPIAYSNWQPR